MSTVLFTIDGYANNEISEEKTVEVRGTLKDPVGNNMHELALENGQIVRVRFLENFGDGFGRNISALAEFKLNARTSARFNIDSEQFEETDGNNAPEHLYDIDESLQDLLPPMKQQNITQLFSPEFKVDIGGKKYPVLLEASRIRESDASLMEQITGSAQARGEFKGFLPAVPGISDTPIPFCGVGAMANCDDNKFWIEKKAKRQYRIGRGNRTCNVVMPNFPEDYPDNAKFATLACEKGDATTESVSDTLSKFFLGSWSPTEARFIDVVPKQADRAIESARSANMKAMGFFGVAIVLVVVLMMARSR
jgi:hypothetical protein